MRPYTCGRRGILVIIYHIPSDNAINSPPRDRTVRTQVEKGENVLLIIRTYR